MIHGIKDFSLIKRLITVYIRKREGLVVFWPQLRHFS